MSELIINPPIYLIGMKIYCWRCQSRMSAVTVLAPNVEETENQICVLCEIEDLPTDIINYIQGRVPTYKLKYSKTVRHKYFANTCPQCGFLSGDFFLHSEVSSPFFPTDEKEASSLYMTEIPVQNQFTAISGLHVGTGELIMNNAKRIL